MCNFCILGGFIISGHWLWWNFLQMVKVFFEHYITDWHQTLYNLKVFWCFWDKKETMKVSDKNNCMIWELWVKKLILCFNFLLDQFDDWCCKFVALSETEIGVNLGVMLPWCYFSHLGERSPLNRVMRFYWGLLLKV